MHTHTYIHTHVHVELSMKLKNLPIRPHDEHSRVHSEVLPISAPDVHAHSAIWEFLQEALDDGPGLASRMSLVQVLGSQGKHDAHLVAGG